ncbi:hypothetical protein CPC08DRAFT_769046 [Agrocybe pediades]|nr:hypothetical protein CPC08DRAFT_769046 [Agrocybe pediades]
MSNAPYRKYDDGLTKQQRYVLRNKEKVYSANAKYKRERRAKLREERQITPTAPPIAPVLQGQSELAAQPPVAATLMYQV